VGAPKKKVRPLLVVEKKKGRQATSGGIEDRCRKGETGRLRENVPQASGPRNRGKDRVDYRIERGVMVPLSERAV